MMTPGVPCVTNCQAAARIPGLDAVLIGIRIIG